MYSDVSGVVNSDVYDYVGGHGSGDVIADVPRMPQYFSLYVVIQSQDNHQGIHIIERLFTLSSAIRHNSVNEVNTLDAWFIMQWHWRE